MTSTATRTVTTTKLAVATLAAVVAGGLAFIVTPFSTPTAVVGGYKCVDSDAGFVPEQQGTLTITNSGTGGVIASIGDICYDDTSVREGYCTPSSSQAFYMATGTCAVGSKCNQGACVPNVVVMATPTPPLAPVVSEPAQNAQLSGPMYGSVRYAWSSVLGAVNYRFQLDYFDVAQNTWTSLFNYNRGNYTSNYGMMSKSGKYRVRVNAIFANGTETPFSQYTEFTYTILAQPDLAFIAGKLASYNNKTLTIPWGNIGATSTRFLVNQTIFHVEALDQNSAVINNGGFAMPGFFRNPLNSTAENDGSGGITYPAGMTSTSVYSGLSVPTGTVKLRITLDPSRVIAESNESNNVFIFDIPKI